MRKLTFASAVAAMALSLTGCGYAKWGGDDSGGVAGTAVSGTGSETTRQFAVSGFTGLILAGNDTVTVRRGDRFSVTATGDPAALDRLLIRVKDGKLEVRPKSGTQLSDGGNVRVTITMPALNDVVLAGGGDLDIDTLSGDNPELTIAGAGDVKLGRVEGRKLELTVAGSGGVEVAGQVQEVELSIAGSGDINGRGLTATKADINIAGSGSVDMVVTGTADVSTMGSGDVTLTGGATCTTSRMGGGTVTCR